MSAEDWTAPEGLDDRACPRCGRSEFLVPTDPPKGRPHHRWYCEECGLICVGSKAERFRWQQARILEAAERDDERAALARHREQDQ